MNDDYLSLASELYINGTWDKETFKKRVNLYANEKNIDVNSINEFFVRVIGKEYTLEEKKNFLSVVTLDGEELKYGNAAHTMKDEMVERFYEAEVSSLSSEVVKKYHELAKKQKDVVQVVNESKDEIFDLDKDSNDKITAEKIHPIRCRIVKEEKVVELPVKIVDEEHKKEEIQDTKPLSDSSESEDIFKLPELFDESKIVITNHSKIDDKMVENKNTENNSNFVVPSSVFEYEQEKDMPETEEEFKKQEEQVTNKEKDSAVRKVQLSPERLSKLKKTKDKVINYFLKGTVVVVALYCLGPIVGVGAIGGYCYFAEEIKAGTFNPTNPVGKAVKHVVEKVMYMGMNKEVEKGGMSK